MGFLGQLGVNGLQPDAIGKLEKGLGHFLVVRVGSGWASHPWSWKISPKNPKFSNCFTLDQKNLVGSGQKIPVSKIG